MAVTTQMIAIALGATAPESGSQQEQQWQMFIDDAEMLIEDRRMSLSAPAPDQAKLDYVVRQAVVGHIQRPDDATTVSMQVDDGQVSRTYRSGTGRVQIRDEWWRLLGLVDDGKAFSIDTVPSQGGAHSDECSLRFGANYCSCGAIITGSLPLREML